LLLVEKDVRSLLKPQRKTLRSNFKGRVIASGLLRVSLIITYYNRNIIENIIEYLLFPLCTHVLFDVVAIFMIYTFAGT